MYLPAVDDERTTAVQVLRVQLEAIRDAGYGLEDADLRATPLRSSLSLAGLLKHGAFTLMGALLGAGRLRGEPPLDPADFYGSFTLAPEESVEGIRAVFEDLGRQYLDLVAESDPDAVISVPPMPWYGVDEPREAALRYLVTHLIEEFARHAGHADLIREQLDGALAAELNAAVEGRPANDYVTPWQRE